jgi:hypothetical protein
VTCQWQGVKSERNAEANWPMAGEPSGINLGFGSKIPSSKVDRIEVPDVDKVPGPGTDLLRN